MAWLKTLTANLFFRGRKCGCCAGAIEPRLAYAEFHRAKAVEQRALAIAEHRAAEAQSARSIRILQNTMNAMRAGEKV